ncbi:MAG TPA: DUF4340 domain-containing protein [Candidatus Acidoferrales bacterium]|nr:DUF4340 domain-containing protein [Candidatus Acidoferrales bacterium]
MPKASGELARRIVVGLLLVALVVIFFVTRPRATPPAATFFPCGSLNALSLTVDSPTRTMTIQRSAVDVPWTLVVGAGAPRLADQVQVQQTLDHLTLIAPEQLHPSARQAGLDGLHPPRLTIACREVGGGSYTLSVGNPSPGAADYYAQKSGDARVVGISAVVVDAMNRVLADPSRAGLPASTG